MASSIIKYVKGAVTLFTLCLIGTATAAPNGNGDEKETKKEVKAEKTVQSTQWFEFIGTPSDSPTDHTKYRALEENEPLPDCPSGNQVCILNAPMGSNNQPDIDSNLQTEINNATSSGVESANVKLRQ
ncbi:hypothetical protein [Sphingobacterium gobiense]|uniref:Uncharacterized protein n=1 Tax=Sphingobacterium gobiense TaxID=1382456 RepID=A0A2S9JGB7_9SPHI|nr:hypothetical protein [Sphingobacterium gobiense]PRD51990.1 hypothetical protein C5749_16975 [Sphingobacterium gobiense]